MLVYYTVQIHNYYIYPHHLQVIYVSLFYSTNTWLSYQSQRSASHQYTFIQWQPSVGLMAHLVNKSVAMVSQDILVKGVGLWWSNI